MSCLLLNPDLPGQIELAVGLLRGGDPVALPTETVYGLAGRLSDEASLSKIFSLKARPHFDPLIVHVNGAEQAFGLSSEVTPLHRKLVKAFWPGPLTMLFKKNPARVPDLCTAGSDKVAVRMPSHPVFLRVLEKLGEPLAAPSANRFGRISPTSALDAVSELGPYGLEAVVDGGTSLHGVESTIVDVNSEYSLTVLRPGALSIESLRAAVGPGVEILSHARAAAAASPVAPGLLASHYAPLTKVYFVEGPQDLPRGNSGDFILLLVYASDRSRMPDPQKWPRVAVLSEKNSDVEAAAHLFRTLRELDAAGAQAIVALRASDAGLGLAINDRLRRAAGRGSA